MSKPLTIAVALLAACQSQPTPAQAPPALAVHPAEPSPSTIERGRYVSALAGCGVCHTPTIASGGPDMSRELAGGLEERMPGVGVWRSPNITQDRETGIGAWTDQQIIDAIRIGARPDGKRLLPIMPYAFYHRMTDADARSILAYLRTVAPVRNKVPRSQLDMQPLPLEQPVDNIDPNERVGHGEYLAMVMHCGACHTPLTGEFAGNTFAGGFQMTLPDGRSIVAPNITSDAVTGIGTWSEADVLRSIRTMVTPDGTEIEGPMAMYRDAWAKLSDADAAALAAYIKSVPPVSNPTRGEHSHHGGV